MPLVEFKCDPCGTTKEVIRSLETMSEVEICPICGDTMGKVISSGSFVLKGKGWAKDGYKGTGGT